jgi:DNA-binding phage protein
VAAGSIVVDLLMKTGAFETDTKRAERRLRELQKEAERAGKVIAAAFVAAAAATGALIKSAIDTADAMSKLAQQTGVSTEALSSLSFAAKLSNVSNEELSRALRRLSADAANGGDKLRALGISLKDAGGASKTADQLFADVAERISKLPDGIQKTNALIELFGDRVGQGGY